MNSQYKFINTPLPYGFDALEPYIDAKTMELHHNRHLQTYIDNLNDILKKQPRYQNWPLGKLLLNVASLPEDIQIPVKNNGGGVFNHQFFFAGLINPSSDGPNGLLSHALYDEFGSFKAFQQKFKEAALSVFGSGYAWLILNAGGYLKIITTANQDTPLPYGFWPILNIDVWEHAYYLKHYNKRADYVNDWFQVVNWEFAEKRYLRCFDG